VRGIERLLFERQENCFENTVHVLEHIVVPEAQDEIAKRFQDARAIRIRHAGRVLATVELDNELCVGAKEIDHKPIDWDLPLEFPSIEPPIAQAEPQLALGIGLIPTQTPRALHFGRH
jgi:hypothetical protein